MRQTLNKPIALLTLRLCRSSNRPSSSSVSALGFPEPAFSIDDGEDEEGGSAVVLDGSVITKQGGAVCSAARGWDSSLLHSMQFKAFLKQAYTCHQSAGKNENRGRNEDQESGDGQGGSIRTPPCTWMMKSKLRTTADTVMPPLLVARPCGLFERKTPVDAQEPNNSDKMACHHL